MKVAVVMPAYNAEKTLERTLNDIPKGVADDIILVDDASTDGTVALSRKLGIHTVVHEKNKGYGGNQKTCYKTALERGADIVIMLHPDYQYDARLSSYMAGLIRDGVCDVMLGSRIRTRREALKGGMPLYKYLMNRLLTLIENLVLGTAMSEMHTGYRAYSRKALETIPFERNSDDFVFDSQFIVQAVHFNFRMGEIPVPTRYFAEASSISFRRSVVYGISTLWTLLRYILHATGLFSYSPLQKK